MHYFTSDYTTGCTPEILEVLSATNLEETPGYGEDAYCEAARALIQKECGRPDAAVYFMMAGTQTNLTIIAASLRPFHGVYGTVRSHINTHEAGAIERGGHKVISLPDTDGKLTASQIAAEQEKYLHDPSREHLVMPKMVYISQPTEIGTLYSKQELEDLYAVCKQYGLYLYIDGARLGYGLTSPACDFTMQDVANNCDVFYIGGTKCGLLFGEAAVILNPAIKEDFIPLMKQCGSVLAKGRLLGIQFEAMFTNGLYYRICKHGIDTAMQIKTALQQKGFEFLVESPTNQQFVILPKQAYEEISKHFNVALWENLPDGKVAVRICTSWSTSQEAADKLCKFIKEM